MQFAFNSFNNITSDNDKNFKEKEIDEIMFQDVSRFVKAIDSFNGITIISIIFPYRSL